MRNVQVLLSTYNGLPYLGPLLDSLLSQRGVRVDVLARDDGSTDGTLEVLRGYAERAPVRVVAGANVGVVRSFFWLLRHASPEADAMAIADQDDVWLPDKLARAVASLDACPPGEAALYCSGVRPVDRELRPLGEPALPPRGPSFENALFENIVAGCTAVLNPAALRFVAAELPDTANMHDWWIYKVLAGRGRVVFDAESRILYRQHGGNVVGAGASRLARGAARVRRVLRRRRVMMAPSQLRELHRIHGAALPPHRRLLLERLIARQPLAVRVRLAASRDVVCQSPWKERAVRGLLALGLA